MWLGRINHRDINFLLRILSGHSRNQIKQTKIFDDNLPKIELLKLDKTIAADTTNEETAKKKATKDPVATKDALTALSTVPSTTAKNGKLPRRCQRGPGCADPAPSRPRAKLGRAAPLLR